MRALGLWFLILHSVVLESSAEDVPTADLSSIDQLPPMPGDAPTVAPEQIESLAQAPEPPKESLPDLPIQTAEAQPEFEITQTESTTTTTEEAPAYIPASSTPIQETQAVASEPSSPVSISKPEPAAQLIDFESLDDEKWQISVPNDMVGDELLLHENSLHSFNGGLGYVRNWQTNPGSNTLVSGYFAAGFLRYQVFLLRAFLFKSSRLQDALSIEGTAFLHRNIHYRVLNDSYFLLSPVASLRYQWSFSPSLAVFAYVGYLRHFVLSSVNGTKEGRQILESQIVTGGGGVIFTFGPGWYLRCDGGFDQWSTGIGIRL